MIKTSKNFLPLSFALLAALTLTIAGCSGGSSSGSHNPYPDADADGINNGNDPDADGDGIPNNSDNSNPPPPLGDPSIPCTTTKIYWPNDNVVAGDNGDIRWELLPKGCGLSATQNKSVKARADSGNVSTASVAKYPGQLITSIRIPCDPQFGSAKRPVNYDFSELGRALNDSQGWYKGTVSHPGPAKGCSGGDGNNGSGGTQCSDFSGTNGGVYPNCTCSNSNHVWDGGACVTPDPDGGGGGSGGGNQCPTGAGGTYPNCKCASGFDYNLSTNTCEAPKALCSYEDLNPKVVGGFGVVTKVTWNTSPSGCIVDPSVSDLGIWFRLETWNWDGSTNRFVYDPGAKWKDGEKVLNQGYPLGWGTCSSSGYYYESNKCYEACKDNPNFPSQQGVMYSCSPIKVTKGNNSEVFWGRQSGSTMYYDKMWSSKAALKLKDESKGKPWNWWPQSLIPR